MDSFLEDVVFGQALNLMLTVEDGQMHSSGNKKA